MQWKGQLVKEGWVATRNGFARRSGLDIACYWFVFVFVFVLYLYLHLCLHLCNEKVNLSKKDDLQLEIDLQEEEKVDLTSPALDLIQINFLFCANAEIYLWRLQYKERRSAISGHGHLRNHGNAGWTFLPHHLVHCATLYLCYLGAGSSIKQYDHLVGPMTTDNLNNLNNLTNKVSYICYNFYACFNFYVSATKYEY